MKHHRHLALALVALLALAWLLFSDAAISPASPLASVAQAARGLFAGGGFDFESFLRKSPQTKALYDRLVAMLANPQAVLAESGGYTQTVWGPRGYMNRTDGGLGDANTFAALEKNWLPLFPRSSA